MKATEIRAMLAEVVREVMTEMLPENVNIEADQTAEARIAELETQLTEATNRVNEYEAEIKKRETADQGETPDIDTDKVTAALAQTAGGK